VASAIAKNPLLIIIPCHRVIGSNGKLTGYSGGIDKKRLLLLHESHINTDKTLLF
jgi:O-6-methylguanine DNA methyltransferase